MKLKLKLTLVGDSRWNAISFFLSFFSRLALARQPEPNSPTQLMNRLSPIMPPIVPIEISKS
jgi:hypothetical protein